MSKAQRQLRGRIGGLSLIVTHGANNSNLRAARRAFLDRFLKGIDLSLPESERLERAETAKRVYMTQLSFKSSVARARKGRRTPGAGMD
jgi:hypothetical protein